MMNSPELAPDEQIAQDLEREHMRPFYTWKGKELWPYCPQSEIVCDHAASIEDTRGFRWISFVYIHLRRGEKTFEEDAMKHRLFRDAWNEELFRLKIAEFVGKEKVTPDDYAEAKRIYDETMEAVAATRVRAEDTRTEEEKFKESGKKKQPSLEVSPSEPTPSPSISAPVIPVP